MAEQWTIGRILTWTTNYFGKKELDAPRLSAELLLSHALGCDRVRLYIDLDRPLEARELTAFRALIERRVAGASVWYVIGSRDFYGRRFKVDERVLVPRPETELLVERVLELIPSDGGARVLELCAGSGCISITLAAERANTCLIATDLSPDALVVARENAAALGAAERVTFLQGDLDAPLATLASAAPPFDLLIANPPYIASALLPSLPPEVRCEPRLALDGGADGLALIRRIVERAPRLLRPGGHLLLEIGDEQGSDLLELMRIHGLDHARIERDLAGLDRMAIARRP